LTRSLSALFPVRNEESTLRQAVAEWLEVLSELTPQLELVLVDDCSLDSTIELADELAFEYPQVRAIRLPQPSGRTAALRKAYWASTGELVFLSDQNVGLSLWEVRKMWHALETSDIIVAKPPRVAGTTGSPWRKLAAAQSRGGFVLARRDAVEPWLDSLAALAQSAMLGSQLSGIGIPCREIELGMRKPHIASRRWMSQAKSIFPTAEVATSATAAPAPARGEPKRPNYLKSVRDFAFGE
jgi:glycosyltransferase involved in cell wall biosynthesis